jgi:catechol 2,3-dioxygenase-like lactoylglutathione lyase family enzyme
MSQTTSPTLAQVARAHHVALSVADIAASTAWYEAMLGAAVVRAYDLERHGAKVAFVAIGDFQLELIELRGSAPYPTPGTPVDIVGTQGFAHVSFEVDDVDALTESLKARGVDFPWDPQDFPEAGLRTANFLDNEGHQIEIVMPIR